MGIQRGPSRRAHATARVHHFTRRHGQLRCRSRRAQQLGKLPTIGFLSGQTRSAAGQWVAALSRLRELGWIEGRTVLIELRWAEGRFERFAEIAAEFVRLKVDVIVTAGPPVFAAKQATSVIPIVFATVADPLSTGLVASLSRNPVATSPGCR